MDRNEREIYQAALGGEREAFEAVIRGLSRQLFAIAYGILQSREEAEDVVQDALLRAWKSRWRVRDPEKFPAWIATVARNRAHDLLRRRRPTTTEEMANTASAAEEESAGADRRHNEEELRAALLKLPELHRSALTLRYFEKMDYAGIEEVLGLSNGALRGIMGRALQTLRKNLRPALVRST